MTTEERQAYFDQNGVYPIEDSDIPEAERMTPPTAEQIIEGEAIRLKLVAKQYLKDTDWYVSRKAEADIAIPADILALRQQARLDASS
jgi:hypothetical protein|tara:strand:- start:46 stop:309 length:264 start_codon:yes stop_codon:yes gene_type:complete